MATHPFPAPANRHFRRSDAWSVEATEAAEAEDVELAGKRLLTTRDLLALEGLRGAADRKVHWFSGERS